MACQLLDNLFAWALKNESKQPTVNLGLATYTYKAPPKPPILQPGRPPMPPGMPIPVLDGSGSGELFYTPAHIEKFNKFMLSIPASFGGEIKYETALSRGPIQNVSVQITARSFLFAGSYGVQFEPQSGPLNGNFVPTCLPISELEALSGVITGVSDGLVVTMHLSAK